MSNNFWIKDVKNRDGVAFVAVGGRISTSSAKDFRCHCNKLLTEGHTHLVIDMSAVEFIASSGAGTLVVLSEGFHAKSGTVQIMRASESVKRVIDLLNIDRFVVLVSDENEAMANLQTHDV